MQHQLGADCHLYDTIVSMVETNGELTLSVRGINDRSPPRIVNNECNTIVELEPSTFNSSAWVDGPDGTTFYANSETGALEVFSEAPKSGNWIPLGTIQRSESGYTLGETTIRQTVTAGG